VRERRRGGSGEEWGGKRHGEGIKEGSEYRGALTTTVENGQEERKRKGYKDRRSECRG